MQVSTSFDYKIKFAKFARKYGIYNLSSPIPDFGALLMIFDPNGMTFEDFFEVPSNEGEHVGFTPRYSKLFKMHRIPKNVFLYESGLTKHISTNGGAAALSGSLLATEAALIISGKRKKEEIITVPNFVYIDFFKRCFETLNPLSL